MLEDWPPGPLEHLAHLKYRKQTPEKWRADLHQAEAELRNLPPGKTRSDIFAKYSYLWSDVKEYYRQISHEKCWYCETKTGRMLGSIDHYRPKGRVTGTDHPGYWWLAFEWRNWRFCCELCNSKTTDYATGIVGGKGHDFSLVGNHENRRVWHECDYEDLLKEDPMLLDPTDSEDPDLLTFTSDGRPGPAMDDKTTIDYLRVKLSIGIYHLDHSKLNRERRTIYYEVLKWVTKFQKYDLIRRIDRDNLNARERAKEALDNLRDLIAPEAEYSAAARAYLREHRKDSPEWAWIDRLLTRS